MGKNYCGLATFKKDERGYPGWVPLIQLKKAEPIHAKGFAKVKVGKSATMEFGWLAFACYSVQFYFTVYREVGKFTACSAPRWRSVAEDSRCGTSFVNS